MINKQFKWIFQEKMPNVSQFQPLKYEYLLFSFKQFVVSFCHTEDKQPQIKVHLLSFSRAFKHVTLFISAWKKLIKWVGIVFQTSF